MKTRYKTEQQFFVVFAINEREESYQKFELKSIKNQTLGLFDTITNAENQKLSDGEIATALLDSLRSIYSDSTYSKTLISILNWWAI